MRDGSSVLSTIIGEAFGLFADETKHLSVLEFPTAIIEMLVSRLHEPPGGGVGPGGPRNSFSLTPPPRRSPPCPSTAPEAAENAFLGQLKSPEKSSWRWRDAAEEPDAGGREGERQPARGRGGSGDRRETGGRPGDVQAAVLAARSSVTSAEGDEAGRARPRRRLRPGGGGAGELGSRRNGWSWEVGVTWGKE